MADCREIFFFLGWAEVPFIQFLVTLGTCWSIRRWNLWDIFSHVVTSTVTAKLVNYVTFFLDGRTSFNHSKIILRALEFFALLMTFDIKQLGYPRARKVFWSVFNSSSRWQGEQSLVKRFTIPVKTPNFCLVGLNDIHGIYNASKFNFLYHLVKSSPSADRCIQTYKKFNELLSSSSFVNFRF